MFATRIASAAKQAVVGYTPKTTTRVWGGDKGAWPVMATTVGAMIFCFSFAFGLMATHPDARLNKGARKSIFRGGVEDA